MTRGPLGTSQVIAYRPMAVRELVVGLVFTIAVVVGALFGVLEYLGERKLACRDGACTLSYWHAILPDEREVVRAKAIKAVRLKEHKTRRLSQYQVVLVTDAKEIGLGRGPESLESARARKAEIDAFLEDPHERTVTMTVEPFSVAVVVFIVWVATVPALYGWFLTWRRRVVIDRAAGLVHLETRRWPGAAKRQTFALHQISHAEWSERQVSVVLADGLRVPLAALGSKGGNHQDTSNAINAALTSTG